MIPSKTVIISGAGIGGLTTALACAQHGFFVRLFERTDSMSEVGAGLQLSPNAMHCLKRVGVAEEILQEASVSEGVDIRDGLDGSKLTEISFSNSQKNYGQPYCVIHRAKLQSVLLQAVFKNRNIVIENDREFHSLHQNQTKILATYLDTHGLPYEITGDVLISSDGVWSTTRKYIPNSSLAIRTGKSAWRSIIPAPDLPPDLKTIENNNRTPTQLWLAPNSHLVIYPISKGREYNLVAITNDDPDHEMKNRSADQPFQIDQFRNWHQTIREIFDISSHWTRWPISSVDPDGSWIHGRIALLGDAAHAMLPFIAQGASMAIEDAIVIADCLASDDNSTIALEKYQKLRKTRVTRVAKLAESNGNLYHASGVMRTARNLVMKTVPSGVLAERNAWIYRWLP